MFRIFILLLGTAICLPNLCAQAPSPAPITEEHQWLEKFVGTWNSVVTVPATDKMPESKSSGTMTSRMLGSLWVINEIKGDAGGEPFAGIQTIGFDPKKKRYIGTWVDSMNNHLWQYKGQVTQQGKRIELRATGPSMTGEGNTAEYRDSYEFNSPNHCTLKSEVQGEDGKWITFMTGELRRVK